MVGVGGSGVGGYYIYVVSGPGREFWHLPGYVSVGVLVGGLAMLLIGLAGPQSRPGDGQRQRGGDASTNLQAGGDIHINAEDEP